MKLSSGLEQRRVGSQNLAKDPDVECLHTFLSYLGQLEPVIKQRGQDL